ncbi:MAG: FecR family protein [Elusimicrobiota bacterium]
MQKLFLLLWPLGFALIPARINAQSASKTVDYQAVLQEAMKSGKYNQSQDEEWDARVKKISGDVRVRALESEEWSTLEGEMPLDSADFVKTADGVAEVYLDDKGVITVGRNTELAISSLNKRDSEFTLKFGNISAKIQHFLDEKLKIQVRTPSAVCAVRGTEFAVEYSQLGKDTGVAVFDEGRVAVSPLAGNGQTQTEYLVEKNTELTFALSQKRFRPVPLSRMSRYKTSIIVMRARLNVLKKSWKPASDSRKMAIRDKVFKRNIIRREIDKPVKVNKKGKRATRLKKALKIKAGHKAAANQDEAQ